MIRIAHISDLHYSKESQPDISKFIIGPLLNDLIAHSKSQPIDILVFTGDLIDKGGKSFDGDTELALLSFDENVLSLLLNKLSLSKDQIFIIPGNHDLDFSADADFVDDGLGTKLVTVDKVNEFIDEGNGKSTSGISRMLPFKNFERGFHASFKGKHEISNFNSAYELDVRGIKVGVAGFNTAWRCYPGKDDKGRMIIGERQATHAENIVNGCDIKIALMHHPLDWLIDFDRKSVSPFIEKTYDLILCGHAHEGRSRKEETIFGSYYMSEAPANWAYNIRSNDLVHSNGYTIIEFDKDTRVVETINRRYCHTKGIYDCNTDLGIVNGVKKYQLLCFEEAAPLHKELKFAENIDGLYRDEANEHLLSFNTDTKAPKDIKSIFVMPRVVNNIEFDSEKEKEEICYSLEDICKSNDNIVLFGSKESGKTVLLYRILFELAENIKTYHKTPVFVDFIDIGNRRIETIVGRFLGIGPKEVKEYLEGHKIALLVDNFSFNEGCRETLKHLEAFKDKNNIQIIGTCNHLIEGSVLIDILEYAKNIATSYLTIRNYKTKEIKLLIEKWFVDNEDMNKPDKLHKVSTVLRSLNIPSTPLSISMFLWIIEHQENYKPVNNSAMLENFIERLFKKHSVKKVLSGGFDYWNKQRLLADIAHHMYQKGRENYRIPSVDIISFMHDYFLAKKFEFEAEKELAHFLERGVLVKERDNGEVYIRFRFACFFHYFLMKKMDFDPKFKEYVLSESKYLGFVNEIDYFTGLKRDQADILRLILDRMKTEYKGLMEFILSLDNTFDDRFDSSTSVTKTLDENGFVKMLKSRKPTEKDLEHINDNMLDSIKPERGIEKKEESLSTFDRLGELWILAAKLLKNTEETEEVNLKDEAYNDILLCSMAFANLFKYSIDEYLKNKELAEKHPLYNQMKLARNFIPLIHQILLHMFMGTQKLNMVIRDKITKDQARTDISEFERYISIFMYADIRGKDYENYIKSYIGSIRKPYIADMSLVKLTSYYFLRSGKASDPKYLNMISELIVRTKGKPMNEKGKIITRYKNLKKKSKEEQIKLEF
ncbi:MAG TPA: metallophosphoesterase [Candidatus Deferrimicrobiaceae bacterium]|jgi:predicted MPP superfamily phosphohydrolase